MARRKKRDSGGGGASDWLNTYADMVTLILTFFILLFAMSSLDSARFNMVVQAFSTDIDSSDRIVIFDDGPENPDGGVNRAPDPFDEQITNLDDVFAQILDFIQENNMDDSVQVELEGDLIFIRFMEDMLFEPNSAVLRPADLGILEFVGLMIRTIEDQIDMVRIDGHTAAVPEVVNHPVSDRLLSSSRANSVLMYFEDVVGVAPELLLSVGFGRTMPIADNHDPILRAQNRRVEIFISTENVITDQINNIYEQLVE